MGNTGTITFTCSETKTTSVNLLIEQQAALHPQSIAVKKGVAELTYAQLIRKADKLAAWLQARGLRPGDVAALATERTPEMIIAFAALLKAGITYLPIDNSFPQNRISYMLDDAAVKLLITSRAYADKYVTHKNVVYLEEIIAQAEFTDAAPMAYDDPEGIAYILYTSGSTGKPKGVQVKRKGLYNLLLSLQEQPGIKAGDVFLFTTTIAFDIAEAELWLPLISGATVLIADTATARDSRALLDLARKEQVTIMQGTPFMWRMMLEAGWTEPLPIKIFCGGEPLPKELATKLPPLCKELWNMYGPTETTIYSVIKHITGQEPTITIGKPIRHTQVYILNEQMNQLPDGEIGEIYIGGEGVAAGYLNRPELTAERFITDNFADQPGAIMYKTGDLGLYTDTGEIQCLGRIDHQVKIRGYRIETGEIEYQLKQQQGVTGALATPYTDDAGNIHLVAYVATRKPVAETEQTALIKQWKNELAKALPEYMVPDIFMPLAEIPMLPNGKTDRNALPKPVINNSSNEPYVAPATATETALTRMFLSNMAVERMGVNDNFFRMGINSLVMVKVMVQLEKELGTRYPLSVLIKYPTIKQLAELIDGKETGLQYRSLIPIKPDGHKTPLYIVHGIGLNLLNVYHMASMLDPDQPVYGLQAAGLDGKDAPMDSIEAIAAFYNSEILAHNPVGPYAISGYSFGGYVAYEMVRQLKEMGKDVKMLAMFDTNLQIATKDMPLAGKIWIKGSRQFKKLFFRVKTSIKEPVKNLRYLWRQAPHYYYDTLKLLGFDIKPAPKDVPLHMVEIMDKLRKAFYKYTFRPMDVKIDLFKAREIMFYVDDPTHFGWDRLSRQGVNIHVVPGDHHHMFMAPNDKVLARTLQEVMDKLD